MSERANFLTMVLEGSGPAVFDNDTLVRAWTSKDLLAVRVQLLEEAISNAQEEVPISSEKWEMIHTMQQRLKRTASLLTDIDHPNTFCYLGKCVIHRQDNLNVQTGITYMDPVGHDIPRSAELIMSVLHGVTRWSVLLRQDNGAGTVPLTHAVGNGFSRAQALEAASRWIALAEKPQPRWLDKLTTGIITVHTKKSKKEEKQERKAEKKAQKSLSLTPVPATVPSMPYPVRTHSVKGRDPQCS